MLFQSLRKLQKYDITDALEFHPNQKTIETFLKTFIVINLSRHSLIYFYLGPTSWGMNESKQNCR